MPVAPHSLLATINIIEVFEHCDVVGQVITTILAVFSMFAWAVMFGKRGELNSAAPAQPLVRAAPAGPEERPGDLRVPA